MPHHRQTPDVIDRRTSSQQAAHADWRDLVGTNGMGWLGGGVIFAVPLECCLWRSDAENADWKRYDVTFLSRRCTETNTF